MSMFTVQNTRVPLFQVEKVAKILSFQGCFKHNVRDNVDQKPDSMFLAV